jgi:hypothetical protein
MKHDASNKTPHLALIFTEDSHGKARRPFQGPSQSHVTKTKQGSTDRRVPEGHSAVYCSCVVHSVVGIALTFSKLQEKMAHETLRDLVCQWWYKCQHDQLKLPSHEWEAVLKRTLVRWSASGRRLGQQREVIAQCVAGGAVG